MALYSNTLDVIRRLLLSAIGDLLFGDLGTTGATTTKNYSPFLWQADDYYNDHKYHVYIYSGTNVGVDKRVTDWVLSTFLATVHSAYDNACDATSKAEMHRIFTEAELRNAINLAINRLGERYLVDFIDESITLVADVFEYTLPDNVTHVTQVTTEQTADGAVFRNQDIIDPRSWDLISPRKLKLDRRYYSLTAGKDLRIEGHQIQATATSDTSVIKLPPRLAGAEGDNILTWGKDKGLWVTVYSSDCLRTISRRTSQPSRPISQKRGGIMPPSLAGIDAKITDLQTRVGALENLASQQATTLVTLSDTLARLEVITDRLEKIAQSIKQKTDKLPHEFVRAGATYRVR